MRHAKPITDRHGNSYEFIVNNIASDIHTTVENPSDRALVYTLLTAAQCNTSTEFRGGRKHTCFVGSLQSCQTYATMLAFANLSDLSMATYDAHQLPHNQ